MVLLQRQVESALPGGVPRAHVGAVIQQQLRHLELATVRSLLQRREAAFLLRVHVGAVFDQPPSDLRVAVGHCAVERHHVL